MCDGGFTDRLEALVRDGLVRHIPHPRPLLCGALSLYNYTGRMQMQPPSAWSAEARAARGLVVQTHGSSCVGRGVTRYADATVARPLPTFFNLGEGGAPELRGERFAVL